MPYWYVRTKANYFNGIKHNRCEYFRDLNYTDTQVHVLPDFINKCKKSAVCFLSQLSFCRVMLCKRGLYCHTVSACLSVRLSRSYILSKRINISSKFCTVRQPHHFWFFIPNAVAIFRRELFKRGRRMQEGQAEITILSQSLASTRAANAETGQVFPQFVGFFIAYNITVTRYPQ